MKDKSRLTGSSGGRPPPASAARRRGSAGSWSAAGPRARSSSERPARRSSGGGGPAGGAAGRRWRSRPRRTSARPWSPSRRSGPPSGACPSAAAVTASAQVSFVPAASVRMKFDGDPQHVGLAAGFEELPQLGAAAVDLVPADEVEAGSRRRTASAQMSMASCPLVRNCRSSGSPMTSDVTGSSMCSRGDPLPGADQRVPGLLPHIGQVHRVDPVRHPARAPHVLPLHPGRGLAGLLLPGLVDRPDHQAAPARPRRAASSRPATANRRTSLIAANVSHAARFSSRCVRSGVRSPACWAIVHPFRLGSSLTSADTYLPACSHVSAPHETRPQQPQQLDPFPAGQPGPYPGSSSRLRFCCLHKQHDRQAAAPCQTEVTDQPRQVKPPMAAAVLDRRPDRTSR